MSFSESAAHTEQREVGVANELLYGVEQESAARSAAEGCRLALAAEQPNQKQGPRSDGQNR